MNGSPFYLFGDWNSRVLDMPDFIEGIDILPEMLLILQTTVKETFSVSF